MGIDRTVRRFQTITPFGVGGIYDFGSESFVGMDTTKWKVGGDPELRLPRLERILGVQGFRADSSWQSLVYGAHAAGSARIPFPSRYSAPTAGQ